MLVNGKYVKSSYLCIEIIISWRRKQSAAIMINAKVD